MRLPEICRHRERHGPDHQAMASTRPYSSRWRISRSITWLALACEQACLARLRPERQDIKQSSHDPLVRLSEGCLNKARRAIPRPHEGPAERPDRPKREKARPRAACKAGNPTEAPVEHVRAERAAHDVAPAGGGIGAKQSSDPIPPLSFAAARRPISASTSRKPRFSPWAPSAA